mgnify:CR=1 FL=1
MLHVEKWKIYLTILLCILGVAYAVPNMLSAERQAWLQTSLPGWLPNKTINLGLDLQGGSHLLLQVNIKPVLVERMEAMVESARSDMRREKIGFSDIGATDNGITFRLKDVAKDRDAAYKIARSLDNRADVRIDNSSGIVSVTLDERAMDDIKAQIVSQSIEIVRRRVDESGTKEPIIQRQGTDRIVVQLPGVDDPQRIKDLIGKTAKLTFHLLDEDAMVTGRSGPSSLKLPLREAPNQMVIVRKRVMVTGEMLTDAQPSMDQQGPVVAFQFDSIGAKRFCEVSKENIGKPFAIVLDKEVISAPVIQSAICGGRGQISGGFTVKETADLALLLRAGALPAELKVVEERSVGPTLGSDSVASGKKAAVYGFAIVCVMMVAFYGLFGVFANIALVFNVAFIFALMSLLQATLTLPGIAGIVLTIGMAVDANVLIYERIREEIRRGRSVLSSVDTGYRQAMSTIVDSNLTTLIVALILFSFGTGPVKGFAVSMSIGIVTSLFSAVMITRLIVIAWLRKSRPSTLEL